MNNKQDIFIKIVDLGESGLESLEYALGTIEQGNIPKTYEILVGIMEALGAIEEALPLVVHKEDSLGELYTQLISTFGQLVSCCESKDEGDILNTLRANVLPAYRGWLECLKDNLETVPNQ